MIYDGIGYRPAVLGQLYILAMKVPLPISWPAMNPRDP